MKLGYITFMVRDLEQTIYFYQELVGLKVMRRFNPGMGEIAFLANEEKETMLEFIQFEEGEKVETKGMVMSFAVDEKLETVREKACAMGLEPSEIIIEGQKPAHFTVCDPDGIVVEFTE